MIKSPLPTGFIKQLSSIVDKERLLRDPADCWSYGYDNSRRHAPPSLVVLPQTHEETMEIVALCNQFHIPLVTRGRGTGTTGATVPLDDAVVLSTERMNRIVDISTEDRYMVVEPGVLNQTVQDQAAALGFFWPPDPTSAAFCTVGGNIAYNSAGPRAVKYGTPRENVLGLRAVTGNGDAIRTGVYTSKGVVGYDLTRLLIGSEGTLAIITEATLKLTPQQPLRQMLQASYRSMQAAAEAVSRIMGQAQIPYALEFIDATAIEMIRQHSQADLPQGAGAILLIEVDGTEQGIHEALEAVSLAASGDGLIELKAARNQQESQALWATRKALSPALRNVAPKKINEDVVVPVSNMAELISGLESLSEKYGITIVNFGHAGNGNIHVNLLVNPDDPEEMSRAEHCLDAVFSLVLDLNGTISGEHGVGLEKRDFVQREIDSVSLDLMRSIKQSFDPNQILNPGKMLPIR